MAHFDLGLHLVTVELMQMRLLHLAVHCPGFRYLVDLLVSSCVISVSSGRLSFLMILIISSSELLSSSNMVPLAGLTRFCN